ncbi:MAG: hypothetical protein QG597_3671, partial [Actinomycetota bacterium]|nr:hypothetical protein [Actinomycetota bacterium]
FLKTTSLTGNQWLLGAAPAVALFLLWELGKWMARRRSHGHSHAGAAS